MSDFEFVFILYALILGLSLIELLTGMGKALELKFAADAGDKSFTIGWLTPALAVFVLLDLLSFWIFAWRVRDAMVVSPPSLLAVMAFASAYFLAARMVFPSDPARFADLDTHYFRVRGLVMAILIALVGFQWLYLLLSLEDVRGLLTPTSVALTLVLVALMAAAMWVKPERLNLAILGLLILRYLLIYLL